MIAMSNINQLHFLNEGMNKIYIACLQAYNCLLYTSDAADEEDSVDLGGRRIIKSIWSDFINRFCCSDPVIPVPMDATVITKAS